MTQLTAMVKVRKAFEQVAVLDLMGELTSSAEAALLSAYEEASNDGALVLEYLVQRSAANPAV